MNPTAEPGGRMSLWRPVEVPRIGKKAGHWACQLGEWSLIPVTCAVAHRTEEAAEKHCARLNAKAFRDAAKIMAKEGGRPSVVYVKERSVDALAQKEGPRGA